MEDKLINTYPRFYTTADVMKILKIGNRACLDLFHRSDFPCVKVGRAFKISEENFREYFSTRRVNELIKKVYKIIPSINFFSNCSL